MYTRPLDNALTQSLSLPSLPHSLLSPHSYGSSAAKGHLSRLRQHGIYARPLYSFPLLSLRSPHSCGSSAAKGLLSRLRQHGIYARPLGNVVYSASFIPCSYLTRALCPPSTLPPQLRLISSQGSPVTTEAARHIRAATGERGVFHVWALHAPLHLHPLTVFPASTA
ncbi:unnamed protein product [Closterium sp. NIES-54]